MSLGPTVTVVHVLALSGMTTAGGVCASAATSAKGMGGVPFLEPDCCLRDVEGQRDETGATRVTHVALVTIAHGGEAGRKYRDTSALPRHTRPAGVGAGWQTLTT